MNDISKAAALLGARNKGGTKRLSQEEIERRTAQIKAARRKYLKELKAKKPLS